MKATNKPLLLGFFLGVILTLVTIAAIHMLQLISKFGKPIVYYDDKAREEIIRTGNKLPTSATDLYYYIDGFQEHTIFIAFSGPRADLDRFVEDATGKKIETLAAWKGQVERDDIIYGPANRYPKYRTNLYNLDQVKHGYYADERMFSGYLVYDRENGRVYCCRDS